MILPRPAPSFEWRETSAGPALVCAPLGAVAAHLFTTLPWALGRSRDGGPGAWDDVAAALGAPAHPLVRVRQVHGCAVVVAGDRRPESAAQELEGDIIVAGAASACGLAVQSADCVPILLADVRTGAFAAAHAGWRGMALRVPGVAVQALAGTCGARPADLVAALGPSIGACCYEVGAEVRAMFETAGFSGGQLARWFRPVPASPADHVPLASLARAPRPGHWYFDGWRSVREQLAEAGVPGDRIFGADLCTAGHPGLLCSYRRDGSAAGRMAAAITASVLAPQAPRSAG